MSSDEHEVALAVKIRSYDRRKDGTKVEELEKKCEIGSTKSPFLFTDTLGDPLCRIRNSPLYKMMVAELGEEMVGIIRGSIKVVSIGNLYPNLNQGEAKVGYILGLRVSPLFRRRGIGLLLVCKMEEWFKANLVEYTYMATEKKNKASIKLFVDKLGYSNFRSPMILVNPVKQHTIHIPSNVVIEKLTQAQAEKLYRKFLSSEEFFPRDIDQVLSNKLSLGTWIAHAQGESWHGLADDDDDHHHHHHRTSSNIPTSWAMLSVWNCVDVFKLRVGRAHCACVLLATLSRLVSRILKPCIRVPSIPNIFSPFGFYFMYGIHGEGLLASKLVNSLCNHVHNLAVKTEKDCKVIVTEIGGFDQLRHHIPHCKLLSCSEDLLCMKKLFSASEDMLSFDWTKTPPPSTLFIDPRDV